MSKCLFTTRVVLDPSIDFENVRMKYDETMPFRYHILNIIPRHMTISFWVVSFPQQLSAILHLRSHLCTTSAHSLYFTWRASISMRYDDEAWSIRWKLACTDGGNKFVRAMQCQNVLGGGESVQLITAVPYCKPHRYVRKWTNLRGIKPSSNLSIIILWVELL